MEQLTDSNMAPTRELSVETMERILKLLQEGKIRWVLQMADFRMDALGGVGYTFITVRKAPDLS